MTEFNPNDHLASDVKEHLGKADPEEFARVMAAEEAGQARVSVLSFTQASVDPASLDPGADGYTRRVISS